MISGKISIIILLLFQFGCTLNPDPTQLTIVFSGDPKSTDPALGTDVRSGQLCAFLYDNLVRFGQSTEILPAIAESWEISEDGLHYTFNIRHDVKFQDGDLLECNDIKNAFHRLLSPHTASHRKWLFNNVEGAASFINGDVDNVHGFNCNGSSFTISLLHPFSPFLGFLAMPSASIIKESEGEIIGTGPWILDEWIHDGHILLRKNEDYFDGASLLSTLKIRILPEALPRTAEFITGYVDIMEIPDAEFTLWNEDEDWAPFIKYQEDLNIFYLGMNCTRPPLDDVKVRQAIHYAVDIESIINNLKNGNANPAYGPIPPSLMTTPPSPRYEYNPQKAKMLMAQSNLSNGFEIELWQSQSSNLLNITEAIQAQLQKVNINVKIVRNDWNMYSQAITQGSADMYYRSWYADYPHAENFLAPLFESTISKKRWTRYTNDELDTYIELIQKTSNESQQQKYIKLANDILVENVPWVYLWHSKTAFIHQPHLKNWSPRLMYNAEKYTRVHKE